MAFLAFIRCDKKLRLGLLYSENLAREEGKLPHATRVHTAKQTATFACWRVQANAAVKKDPQKNNQRKNDLNRGGM